MQVEMGAETSPWVSSSSEDPAGALGDPASSRASSHVGVIFGALWRPLLGVRRAFALRGPQPGAPGTPTCSPGEALPSSPTPAAGQQALTNKRPIRRRGSADEWTFRFQAWHRLGFPGVLGRAGRSHLPERGHGWGRRVLKTPTSRSPRDELGEVKAAAERPAREQSCGPGAPAAPQLGLGAPPPAERGRPASPPARPAAARRRHPRKPNADCQNKKGLPGKMRSYQKTPSCLPNSGATGALRKQ